MTNGNKISSANVKLHVEIIEVEKIKQKNLSYQERCIVISSKIHLWRKYETFSKDVAGSPLLRCDVTVYKWMR
jgi:hypothetical protein